MSISSWHCLPHVLQSDLIDHFRQTRDVRSIQALLQTSKELRKMASASITTATIEAQESLLRFPRHAYLKTIAFRMAPQEADRWLRDLGAAGHRLQTVQTVEVLCSDLRLQVSAHEAMKGPHNGLMKRELRNCQMLSIATKDSDHKRTYGVGSWVSSSIKQNTTSSGIFPPYCRPLADATIRAGTPLLPTTWRA